MNADHSTPAARFHTSLLATGKTTTGITVPPGNHRTTRGREAAPGPGHHRLIYLPHHGGRDGRQAMIPVSADHRRQAGIAAGDQIGVTVELDTQPRDADLPADLAEALGKDPAAHQFFDGLSPSQKKWHVQQAETAKTPETRQRRIAKSIELLHNQRAR